MKFKYYLRGAGIGVIVTTVVLSVAFLFQNNISDAEVIQRALELGMVMEEGSPQTLADLPKQNPTEAGVSTVSSENGNVAGTDSDDGSGASNKKDEESDNHTPNGDADENADGGKDTKDEGTSGKSSNNKSDTKNNSSIGSNKGQQQGEKVTVTIVGGDVSRTVSAKVFEAGLVDSADEFNDFLGDNDYDNQLQPGTYEVKMGSSFKEIAEILTKR